MWSKSFWGAALERAIKSAANTLLVLWAGDQGFDIVNVNLEHAFSLSAGAAVVSILMSISSAGIGNNGPSLASETLVPPASPAQPAPQANRG